MILLLPAAYAQGLDATGRFVSNQERATIDAEVSAAVDRSAASVSALYRGIARPRLAQEARVCPAYTTSLEGDVFTFQCDGEKPFTWTIGTTGPWQGTEETLTVTSAREGDTIRIDLKGTRGGKRYAYTFDGGGLQVAHEIYSPYLGEPLKWTLTYSKSR